MPQAALLPAYNVELRQPSPESGVAIVTWARRILCEYYERWAVRDNCVSFEPAGSRSGPSGVAVNSSKPKFACIGISDVPPI